MGIYYKATTPDGLDFHTKTVDYAGHLASGEPLPLLTADVYRCCTNTVYHASDTPSETLIGCSWPCRLFEVEGEPVAEEDHKFGFRTFTVVREIEAWRALGPNGESVVAVIKRAGSLTAEEALGLYSAWDAAMVAAMGAALDAAMVAAMAAARVAARDAARIAAMDAAWVAARDAAGDAVRDAAGDAAEDAVTAVVVRDLITEEHFNTLYSPWDSVINKK